MKKKWNFHFIVWLHFVTNFHYLKMISYHDIGAHFLCIIVLIIVLELVTNWVSYSFWLTQSLTHLLALEALDQITEKKYWMNRPNHVKKYVEVGIVFYKKIALSQPVV